MNIEDFVKLRPYAYHTTAADNLALIRHARAIESTRRLFERSGQGSAATLRERRKGPLVLVVDGQPLRIRDQQPLHAGNIAFEPGWDMPRFVAHLNGFAFFWPGDQRGPIGYGSNHFDRYADAGESLIVLRVATRALFARNRERAIRFSDCNSGSPRMSNGKPRPRGDATFSVADAFIGTPGQVKEIVIEDFAILPPEVEFAAALEGPWQLL